MPIANLRQLTEEQFKTQLKALIAQLEGNKPLPYFDSASPALITIGIGFNIDKKGGLRDGVYEAMGIDPREWPNFNEVFAAPQMTTIRAMPQATSAQLAAKNQALQSYLETAL